MLENTRKIHRQQFAYKQIINQQQLSKRAINWQE